MRSWFVVLCVVAPVSVACSSEPGDRDSATSSAASGCAIGGPAVVELDYECTGACPGKGHIRAVDDDPVNHCQIGETAGCYHASLASGNGGDNALTEIHLSTCDGHATYGAIDAFEHFTMHLSLGGDPQQCGWLALWNSPSMRCEVDSAAACNGISKRSVVDETYHVETGSFSCAFPDIPDVRGGSTSCFVKNATFRIATCR